MSPTPAVCSASTPHSAAKLPSTSQSAVNGSGHDDRPARLSKCDQYPTNETNAALHPLFPLSYAVRRKRSIRQEGVTAASSSSSSAIAAAMRSAGDKGMLTVPRASSWFVAGTTAAAAALRDAATSAGGLASFRARAPPERRSPGRSAATVPRDLPPCLPPEAPDERRRR